MVKYISMSVQIAAIICTTVTDNDHLLQRQLDPDRIREEKERNAAGGEGGKERVTWLLAFAP